MNIETTYILTADDDRIYTKDFVYNFNKIIPNNNIVYSGYTANRGKPITVPFGADGILLKLSQLNTFKKYYDIIIADQSRWFEHDDYIIATYLYYKNITVQKMRQKSFITNLGDDYCSLTSFTGEGGSRDRLISILNSSYIKLQDKFKENNI